MEEPGMIHSPVLRGIATVTFFASDVDAAKNWYAELLGIEPYFKVPGYAEFRFGDYQLELGIIDRRYARNSRETEPAGAIVYWHVDDIQATLERLLSMGAKKHQELQDRGNGFITASVEDPFGNILGIMFNPHYLEVLDSVKNDNTSRSG